MNSGRANPLAELLDWTDRDKACALALLTVPLILFYYLWLTLTWHFTEFSKKYFNPESVDLLITIYSASCLGWLGLFSAGVILKRFNLSPKTYSTIVINFYGLSLVPQGYMIGLMTPLTGLILLGATLVGFVLFDFRRVFIAFLINLLLIGGFSWFTASGAIPYAPLFDSLPVSKETAEPYWIVSQFLLGLPFVAGAVSLNQSLLARWRAREAATRRLSMTDELTGLANRRAILSTASHEISRASRNNGSTSLAILDLDHFKNINDNYGHDVGDLVLKHAASVLTACLRNADWVGRYGGEEFVIMLPETTWQETSLVLERCRHQLEITPVILESGEALVVTASFGVFNLRGCQVSLDEALKRADQALYKAKESGRNRVALWHADYNAALA